MYEKNFIDLYLKNGFEYEEAISEIRFICDILYGYDTKSEILGKTLLPEEIKQVKEFIEERVKTRRPIQQIAGKSFFFGKVFYVSKDTLIPRPETELLVQEALSFSKNFKEPKILDIGTGTGCIPVTLVLENTDIKAFASDISIDAIKTAKKNAELYNLNDKIDFIQSDLFENITGKFDIIVSNPPYIPLKDKKSLQIEVRDFDPSSALFAPDDKGIYFYEQIIKQSPEYLNKNGILIFELGINQCPDVENIFVKYGFRDIKILKDFNGIERVISAKYNA